jgi:hypothetical protein
MVGHRQGRGARRLAVVIGLAAVLTGGGAAAASHAAGLPDPLGTATDDPVGSVTGTVTGTATGLAGAATGTTGGPATPGAVGSGTPSPETTPSPTPDPATRPATRPASRDTGSTAPAQRPAGSPSRARAPSGSASVAPSRTAAEADVPGLVGACVRVTRQGAPVQSTLVVLDRDLIDELIAAGVPLEPLIVPCPRPAASPPAGVTGSGAQPARTPTSGEGSSASKSLASFLPGRLAFTGSGVLLLGGAGALLLALGVAATRRATALRTVAARE